MRSATATATTARTAYSRTVRVLEVGLSAAGLALLLCSLVIVSLEGFAAVYQRLRSRESGQYVQKASPMISWREAGPQSRLSSLTERLSPIRK